MPMRIHGRLIVGAAVVVGAVWAALAGVVVWGRHRLNDGHGQAVPVIAKAQELPRYWSVPGFSFVDQDGKVVTDRDLRGRVWVADFIFTTCTTQCPAESGQMVKLSRKLPGAKFVSFSVDPAHDTPAALGAYRKLWGGDFDWTLLSTDPAGLAAVSKGMNIATQAVDDAVNPIIHSDLLFLIDGDGHVRGFYASGSDEAMDRLAADYRRVAGPSTAELLVDAQTSAIGRGKTVYTSMGCAACHRQAKIAPPTEGLYGSVVRLDDGTSVWADEAYLHQSIVDPNAKVVAGFHRIMPNYQSSLSDMQITDLVAYLKSIGGPGGDEHHGPVAGATTGPATETAIDPVCHMKLVIGPDTARSEVGGSIHYFCSSRCKEAFEHSKQ